MPSKFDKLTEHIAKEYEERGYSREKAEEIGRATAAKIGRKKYGERYMERKSQEGRK
jgi:hypothetical protein